MQNPPYMHVEPVRRHFDFLIEKGVPQEVIEKALGFSKKELANDNLKIPVHNTIKMLKQSLELIGRGTAITMGAMASPEIMGVLGQIMKNCRNLKEAADQFIRFQNLYFAISKFKIEVRGSDSFIISSVGRSICDDDKRLLNEVNLSICVASIRKLLGADFVPKEMRFSHVKPKYVEIYEQHFQCPLKFNQKEDAIVIDSRLGEKAIPGSYP